MIDLLAPTTTESAVADPTVIIEMSGNVLRALAVAVEVAFEDPDSTPPAHKEAATELWEFFVNARTAPQAS